MTNTAMLRPHSTPRTLAIVTFACITLLNCLSVKTRNHEDYKKVPLRPDARVMTFYNALNSNIWAPFWFFGKGQSKKKFQRGVEAALKNDIGKVGQLVFLNFAENERILKAENFKAASGAYYIYAQSGPDFNETKHTPHFERIGRRHGVDYFLVMLHVVSHEPLLGQGVIGEHYSFFTRANLYDRRGRLVYSTRYVTETRVKSRRPLDAFRICFESAMQRIAFELKEYGEVDPFPDS